MNNDAPQTPRISVTMTPEGWARITSLRIAERIGLKPHHRIEVEALLINQFRAAMTQGQPGPANGGF